MNKYIVIIMTNLQLNDYIISITLDVITPIFILLFLNIKSYLYCKKIHSSEVYSINNNYPTTYNSAYKAVEDNYITAYVNTDKIVE
jgi:hypothetical protein